MNTKVFRAVLPAATVVGLAAVLRLVGLAHDRDEPLVVSRLILVDSHEVDRDVVVDTYRAELTHTGSTGSQDFAGVTATVVQPFGFPGERSFQLVDGDLEFGAVRAGATVDSRDTLTIRRHRRVPLKPHQLRWEIAARPDLVLSDAWAGQWRFTITSKDADTNQVTAVDEIVDSIGIDEPVGFSLLPESVRCRWTGTNHFLEADCRARFSVVRCFADASAHFNINRNGSAIAGHGQWRVTVIGDCGPIMDSGREAIDIVGTRLSDSAEAEPFSPGVLTKLATTPALIRLVAEGRNGTVGDPPRSDDDCKRGRWRRLANPWFRNARACAAFAARHHDGRDEGRR